MIYRLDRLSRNLRHFITLFEALLEHGVTLDVVTSPELGVAALDKLMLNVLASFAEFKKIWPLPESRKRATILKLMEDASQEPFRSGTLQIVTRSSWSSATRRHRQRCECSDGPSWG